MVRVMSMVRVSVMARVSFVRAFNSALFAFSVLVLVSYGTFNFVGIYANYRHLRHS